MRDHRGGALGLLVSGGPGLSVVVDELAYDIPAVGARICVEYTAVESSELPGELMRGLHIKVLHNLTLAHLVSDKGRP